jgi:hypothetical protein
MKAEILEGIRSGVVSHQYRRWTRPRVKPGSLLRTAVGLVRITAVDVVEAGSLTPGDARAAGLEAVSDLVDAFPDRTGDLYRIGVEYEGPDPRKARREQPVSADELPALVARPERFDRYSKHGPWTRQTLALIEAGPETRAEDLAGQLGWEKQPFKTNVRKLKELGLTESLKTGYRLSPRGISLRDQWP